MDCYSVLGKRSRTALSLSVLHGITAYDASYVALSDMVHVPLITADEILIRKLSEKKHRIRCLGELPAHSR